MKLKKGNNRVNAFDEGKLKLVNDVLLYYNFLYQDNEDALTKKLLSGTIQISENEKAEAIP